MQTIAENIPMISKMLAEYQANPVKQPEVKEVKIIEEPCLPENKYVHERVTCDGCGIKPIVGNRWKCSVCEDFDYCDKCEAKTTHAHPFLKIKNASQYPVAITVILPEEKPVKRANKCKS